MAFTGCAAGGEEVHPMRHRTAGEERTVRGLCRVRRRLGFRAGEILTAIEGTHGPCVLRDPASQKDLHWGELEGLILHAREASPNFFGRAIEGWISQRNKTSGAVTSHWPSRGP